VIERTAIHHQSEGPIAQIRFARPDAGDPIDATFCRELREVVDEIAVEAKARAVVITAQGKHFSLGGNIKDFSADRARFPGYVQSATVDINAAMSRLASLPVPVIVAVNGLAVGGSLSLVAVADYAIAARSASFFSAFVGIGLSPDMGSTYFVSRRVGSRHAANLYLLNETWSADEALSRGLISAVVDDAKLARATDLMVERLAAGPTRALGNTKRLLWQTWDGPLEAQLEREAQSIVAMARTDDAWEGLAAVGAKRNPRFRGE
jgi:2-(1,2-epoxy-1,2-dihydrophenyl)acetyl-CoA isomerase